MIVLPGLRRVRIGFPLGFTNAYLVDAADGPTLVDTGVARGARAIGAAISESGRAPSDLRHIALTHAHFDHAGAVARLARATGARAWIHAADADAMRTGSPGPLPTFEPEPIAAVMRRLPQPGFRGWPDVAEFEDAAVIAGDLRAIHTPGHTPGQTAFLWPAHGGVLFTGDALTNFGKVRLGIFNVDWAEAKASARRLAELDFDTVVFGHGPAIRGGAAVRLRRDIERLAR